MGGNCTKIPVQVAPINPDDQIGVPITIPGGCAMAGSGQTQFANYIPQNGEYEWAGEGSTCYYCSLDQPNSIGCNAGCDGIDCCAIVGTQGTYKRKSYKADPVECCKTGKTSIDNLTCDPKYRNPQSKDCYSIIKDFCIKGDNLETQDVCKSWCVANPEECLVYEAIYCNNPITFEETSLKSGFCKNWCHQNPGNCDQSVEIYCSDSANANDLYCACLNSQVKNYKDDQLHQYNPICVDQSCIDHGYQTSSMLSARGDKCQDIVDCSTYFDIQAGGKVQFSDVNIQQRCGAQSDSKISTSTTTTTTPANSTGGSGTSSSSSTPSNISNHKALIIGTVIALCIWTVLIFIMAYFALRKS